jgi:hypothetical protein
MGLKSAHAGAIRCPRNASGADGGAGLNAQVAP